METRSTRPKRSVRHAAATAERQAPAPTRRHLSRARREQRLRRLLLAAAAVVLLLVALIPAYGYYREVIRQGDATALVVDGQTFTLEDYARYVGTRQQILTTWIGQAASRVPTPAPPTTPAPGRSTPTPSADQLAAQRTLQALQSEQVTLTSSALSDLVEAKLVLTEAQARGLTASPTELDDALRWLMSSPPSDPTPSPGLPTVPATLPVTTTVSLEQARQGLAQLEGNGRFLSRDQITELILEPAVLKPKLVAAMAGNVATTAEQVHARHILVPTAEEAQAVRQELLGGADFAEMARKHSTDTSTKDKGGDLGWFNRGVMVPEFEQAAFSLPVGQISEPIKSQFGYHIIQVLEKDPDRPLDPARLAQLREQGYREWLNKAQADPARVTYGAATAKLDWVRAYVARST